MPNTQNPWEEEDLYGGGGGNYEPLYDQRLSSADSSQPTYTLAKTEPTSAINTGGGTLGQNPGGGYPYYQYNYDASKWFSGGQFNPAAFAGDYLNQQQGAWNTASAVNNARYNDINANYDKLAGQLSTANANVLNLANQQNQDVNAGYQNRQDTAMGMLEGLGASQKADIERNFANQAGNIDQTLANRGLYNSTLAPSMQSGLERQKNYAVNDWADKMAQQRLGTYTGLSGDTLGAKERGNTFADQMAINQIGTQLGQGNQQLAFQERRSDTYPDLSNIGDIFSKIGMGDSTYNPYGPGGQPINPGFTQEDANQLANDLTRPMWDRPIPNLNRPTWTPRPRRDRQQTSEEDSYNPNWEEDAFNAALGEEAPYNPNWEEDAFKAALGEESEEEPGARGPGENTDLVAPPSQFDGKWDAGKPWVKDEGLSDETDDGSNWNQFDEEEKTPLPEGVEYPPPPFNWDTNMGEDYGLNWEEYPWEEDSLGLRGGGAEGDYRYFSVPDATTGELRQATPDDDLSMATYTGYDMDLRGGFDEFGNPLDEYGYPIYG